MQCPGGKTSRQGQCRKIRSPQELSINGLCKNRDRQITGIEELNKMIYGVRRTKYQKKSIRNHLEKKFMRYEQTHMLPLDVTQLMEIKKTERANG